MSGQVSSGNWFQPLPPNPIFGGLPVWQISALGSFVISRPIDVTGYDRLNMSWLCLSGPVAGQQASAILVTNSWNPNEYGASTQEGFYVPFIQFDGTPTPATLAAGTAEAIVSASGGYTDVLGNEDFTSVGFNKKIYPFPPTTVSSGWASGGVAVLDVAGLSQVRVILLKTIGVATTVVQLRVKKIRLY